MPHSNPTSDIPHDETISATAASRFTRNAAERPMGGCAAGERRALRLLGRRRRLRAALCTGFNAGVPRGGDRGAASLSTSVAAAHHSSPGRIQTGGSHPPRDRQTIHTERLGVTDQTSGRLHNGAAGDVRQQNIESLRKKHPYNDEEGVPSGESVGRRPEECRRSQIHPSKTQR